MLSRVIRQLLFHKSSEKRWERVIWLTHLAQVFKGALGRACAGAGKGAGRDVVGRGLGRVDAEVCHAYTTGSRPRTSRQKHQWIRSD